jgi:hypothetical protein
MKPIKIRQEVVNKILSMFKQIQNIYKENSDRINMLNYAFLLAKIFKMLGLSELTNYLKAVKSKDKIKEQEKIFKNICEKLNWI